MLRDTPSGASIENGLIGWRWDIVLPKPAKIFSDGEEFQESVCILKPSDYWRNDSAFGVPLHILIAHDIVRCPEVRNCFVWRPDFPHDPLALVCVISERPTVTAVPRVALALLASSAWI
jgi:hypothetical protein